MKDKIDFHPYFFIKDALSVFSGLLLFAFFVFYFPNLLGHSDNYIMANSLVTPTHIVPERYFSPFYAILRAIPNKIGGVIAMLAAILVLFTLPSKDKARVKSPKLRILSIYFFIMFVFNFLFLGFLGYSPAEEPYILLSRISTIFYFSYFLLVIPLTNRIEALLLAAIAA